PRGVPGRPPDATRRRRARAMGKGKQKGWRPPKDDGGALGMLFGSADHITGHSVASPVTLRQDGVALPKNHPNYGDDKGKGKGKGGGKGDAAPAATAAMPPPDVPVKTDGAKPRPVAARWARKATVKTEADACKPGDAEAALAEPVKPAVPLPSKEGSTKPVAKLEDDGLTEIERRRRGMAAAQSEIERRRRAEEEQTPRLPSRGGGGGYHHAQDARHWGRRRCSHIPGHWSRLGRAQRGVLSAASAYFKVCGLAYMCHGQLDHGDA
ncbi:unnamed protein product, partial [Prorocentrum cordatum]